jgi:hypothetical protein
MRVPRASRLRRCASWCSAIRSSYRVQPRAEAVPECESSNPVNPRPLCRSHRPHRKNNSHRPDKTRQPEHILAWIVIAIHSHTTKTEKRRTTFACFRRNIPPIRRRSRMKIAEPGHPKTKTRQANRRVRAQAQDETCSRRVETPAERPQYSIYRIPFAEGEADCE